MRAGAAGARPSRPHDRLAMFFSTARAGENYRFVSPAGWGGAPWRDGRSGAPGESGWVFFQVALIRRFLELWTGAWGAVADWGRLSGSGA